MTDRDTQKLRSTILEIVEYVTFNLDSVTPQVIHYHLVKRYRYDVSRDEVIKELNMLVALDLLETCKSYKLKE